MTSYILIHGGSHGSWFWEPVAEELRARGHHARAIDLPGRDREPSNVTLEDWLDHLSNEVNDFTSESGEPPVLVAHSMGGLSASQFAERRPAAIRSAIYVCAVVPTHGESGLQTLAKAGAESALLAEGVFTSVANNTRSSVDPAAAATAFYGRCSQEVIAEAIPRLVPEVMAPLLTPLSLGTNFRAVNKFWIASTQDRAVPYSLQQDLAAQCGASLTTIDADHSPVFSAQTELVKLLEELGGKTNDCLILN
jgi:pimeloyl-ACP methyl ester carboxylesterase